MSVANMSVAQTIFDQLQATSKVKMWSWGSHDFVGEQKSNREGYLKFKVNGHHFKGVVRITLELNGHERFSPQPHEYFYLRQIYDYHTAIPRQNIRHCRDLLLHENVESHLGLHIPSNHIASDYGFTSSATNLSGASGDNTIFVPQQTGEGTAWRGQAITVEFKTSENDNPLIEIGDDIHIRYVNHAFTNAEEIKTSAADRAGYPAVQRLPHN